MNEKVGERTAHFYAKKCDVRQPVESGKKTFNEYILKNMVL